LPLLFATSAAVAASPRHRAVAPPPPDPPAVWLAAHAVPLATTEAVGGVDDLAPLATIAGDASIVGMGDVTHGTHELYTSKLRVLQFLVERMGFDVLAMEGSFPQMERVNAYIQGGPGDLHQLLRNGTSEIYYYFWDTQEFAAVIDWMRNYNMTRGNNQPAIEIFGADVYDGVTAEQLVIDYLNTVDPSAVG